ncbi:MAG: CDP-glycerol glycerophosphotransferase family protein, partial [Methanobacteriaceae archaeon]
AFSYLKFKKDVNVVQLWHGSGTIKKFGLDTEDGLVKELATKANKKNTHLIIESESMRREYKSAFGMDDSKIFATGCPRTDMFFDTNTVQNKIANFYNKYSELKNKKIILYAPTFRDNRENDLDNNFNIDKILANTSEDYVIGLRLHPHISKDFNFDNNNYNGRVYNFTDFEGVNTLLLVSDILISDYSSIIFEYSLLNKDMVFFPYDFSSFEKSERGFYRDYMTFLPGSVVKSNEELISELKFIINYHKSDSKAKYYTNCPESNESINIYNNKSISYNHTKINNFRKEFMEKSDGNASKRLFELLYG